MDEPSQSNHHGGHVFAVLLRSMCRWNGGVGTSSHLVGLRTLPRSKLDCSDFAGVLRLERMSRAELVGTTEELLSISRIHGDEPNGETCLHLTRVIWFRATPPTVTFLEVRNKIRELKVANRKEIRSKHQIISKKRGTNVSTALAVSIHGGISRTREMWNEILKIGPSPTKNQGGLLRLEVQTLSQQSKERTEARLSSQQLAVVYKEGIKQLHGITHGVSIPD
uniref:Uncharacterized protein n=1 Tax=Brassica oleracea var. oleracea TaxID=109376 RepID=A0A0D3AT31_BRAOL